jgi:hypothetical protein
MDKNVILFGTHVLGIYLIYPWYIPDIFHVKTFWGFQMENINSR